MPNLQLITVEADPYNAETPLAALADPLTPAALFYVRNHFAQPELETTAWRLRVGGLVAQALDLPLGELEGLGEHRLAVTLECAGNGRKALGKPVEGTPWGFGATSTARFAGVPLARVLERAGVRPEAQELVFTGADTGEVKPGRQVAYARSLPAAVAGQRDTLLAWSMNDAPLPAAHGGPVRLVVPGWYGMASVKWLTSITTIVGPFDGYYQRERYIYADSGGASDAEPVTVMRVRAVIAYPADGARLPLAPAEVRGTAWVGGARVAGVAVSLNGGQSWQDAELQPPSEPYGPATWRYPWQPTAPGPYIIVARAADSAGRRQPLLPSWNYYGYGNNVVQGVRLAITA